MANHRNRLLVAAIHIAEMEIPPPNSAATTYRRFRAVKMMRTTIVARETSSAPIAAILDDTGGRFNRALVASDVAALCVP